MSNEATVREYFTCLDTEDWDRMRELWQPESEMRAVGARPRVGIDAVIDYFSGLFSPWVEHEDRPTRLLASGDSIVAEVTFFGLSHAGQRVAFDAVDVFDLQDGRIRRLTNWYDLVYARKVLSGP
jgi:ketosteroid isomerase-like protein